MTPPDVCTAIQTAGSATLDPMTSREDIHRLVDALPAARLPAVEQLLRASLEETAPTERRRFVSAGSLSAEHDLAEWSEEILRSDEGPDDLDGRDETSA